VKEIIDAMPYNGMMDTSARRREKMEKYMNLQELTRRESGIVIYNDAREAIICNWSSIDGLPRVSPFGYGLLGLGEEVGAKKIGPVSISTYMDGVNVIYSVSDEELPAQGTAYSIDDGDIYIIVPDDWC
jgi:hypothetical protein